MFCVGQQIRLGDKENLEDPEALTICIQEQPEHKESLFTLSVRVCQ